MAKLIYGERIGKTAQLTLGCTAVVFDEARQKILLTRRTDNGLWCLPGGHAEAGETVAEACLRELWEETGLEGQMVRLIGVYSNPHRIIEYADGNRKHFIALNFETQITGGQLGLSNETSEVGYFTPAEIEHLELMEHHRERIADAFTGEITTFVR